MAAIAAASAELCRLRRTIAQIEGRLADADRLVLAPAAAVAERPGPSLGRRPKPPLQRLGLPRLDTALGGGLLLASLHEIRTAESRDGAAAVGFALALLAQLAGGGTGPAVLWISGAGPRREIGDLYGPGLLALGLDPGRLIRVAVRTEDEAVWAFEAALACRGLVVAVCELHRPSLDLTATRRSALRARESGVTGLLLRLGAPAEPTAAERASGSWPRRPGWSTASHPASAGWPGGWRWKRTAAAGPLSSRWNGTPMTEPSPNRPTSSANPMRFLSLWLPRLSVDRILRRERANGSRRGAALPEAKPAPRAVVAKEKSALRLVMIDRVAERRGLAAGMSLADARGVVPDLLVEEWDAAADAALLEAVADWCDRYTPLVALDPPHGLFLDISGCTHLFGSGSGMDGEAVLLADCLDRLDRQGFEAFGAIASTPGAAWAVARAGDAGVVPAGAEAHALAGLPVAALRIAAETEALLDRLGLKRIGQLIGQPRAPLASRFGMALVRRLDQALGMEEEALSPRRPAPEISAERRFAEPVSQEEAVRETVRSLAGSLRPALERRGVGARLVELSLFRTDGHVARATLRTAAPVREPDTVTMLIGERLRALGDAIDAGFGIDMMRLAVLETEALDETQIDMAGEGHASPDLARLVDRLGARLGQGRVTRLVPVDTHIPERAARIRPLAALGGAVPAWKMPDAEDEAAPDRPLRLFHRPEPVEVTAEVPEGPPRRFRWRRVVYEVARAEGPERISPEWWLAEDDGRGTRDYYRVEDRDGRRYWLYREGLYGRETGSPAWYVHGLFA